MRRAEVTKNGVLSSPEHRVKASIRADTMIPVYAIIDPQVHCNSSLFLPCPLLLSFHQSFLSFLFKILIIINVINTIIMIGS
jgi:hypothetical protein